MSATIALLLAAADPVPDDADLRAEIARRDVVIANLLERVERLETLLAPQHSPPADSDAMPLDVERALEMVLVERGARLLTAGTVELTPSTSWSTRTDETVALAPLEGDLVAIEERVQSSEVTLGMSARFGLPAGFQAEAMIPYRFVKRDFALAAGSTGLAEASQSTSGVGDIRLTLAKALNDGHGPLPFLIARIGGDLGNARRSRSGLDVGGGFASIGGSLTAVERLDPLVFVGSVRYAHGLSEDGVDPGDSYGGSIGAYLAAGPETSLRFAFDYGRSGTVRFDGVALPASSRTSANFIVGASIATSAQSLVDISAGIGLTPESPDFTLSLAVPIRP